MNVVDWIFSFKRAGGGHRKCGKIQQAHMTPALHVFCGACYAGCFEPGAELS